MQATQEPKSTQAKNAANSHDPILTDEDEAFLRQVMSQPENAEPGASTTAAAPAGGSGGDGGDAVPAAASPPPENTQEIEEFGKSLGEQQRRATSELKEGGGEGKKDEKEDKKEDKKEDEGKKDEGDAEKKKKRWSVNWPWKKAQKEKKEEKADEAKTDDKTTNAESSKDTPDAESQAKPDEETKAKAGEGEAGTGTDNDDMSEILEQLNLAAENNRIFSASDEMQELLRKFKLIFKDLINGVPTAYNDLEMLLKNGNRQLQDTYTRLPTFLQKLIEKLPEKWTDSLAPEIVAAASERAAKSGVNTENVGKAAAAAKKVGLQVPSLKELVGTPAAIVGMLRSIVAFLKARFPAVVGVNILWSLALSILLFVLWYCHKRGKEVRLENERIVTEQEIEKLNEQSANGERPIRPTETLTTTAPRGASADAIRDGVRQVEQSRETSGTDTPTPEQVAQGTNENTAEETAGSTADNSAADNTASDNTAADKSTTGGATTDAAAAGGATTDAAAAGGAAAGGGATTSAAPTGAATGGTAESTTAGNTATTETPASETTAAGQNETPAEAPKRTKSKFGAWARSASKKVSSSKAEPYPGT